MDLSLFAGGSGIALLVGVFIRARRSGSACTGLLCAAGDLGTSGRID